MSSGGYKELRLSRASRSVSACKLTGRNAEISYEADNMEVWVPSGVGEDASHAKWKVNGTLKIRARDGAEA